MTLERYVLRFVSHVAFGNGGFIKETEGSGWGKNMVRYEKRGTTKGGSSPVETVSLGMRQVLTI